MITSQLKQAWQLFQNDRFNEALKITENICRTGNDDAESTFLNGYCLHKLGRHPEALKSFEQSLSYEPYATHVYMMMGSSHLAQNNPHDAEACYKKILQIDPSHLLGRIELAKLITTSGRFDSARKQLLIAQQHNPESGLPHYELGILGRKSKSPTKETYHHLLTAAELEPDNAKYQFALGECLLIQEQYDDAKDRFNNAYVIEPDNPAILSGLASVSVKQGKIEFAIELIDKLLDRNIYMPDISITFLLCCKHVHRCNDAIEYALTCLNNLKLPTDTCCNIHSKLASVLDNMKQYDQAWLHLQASKDDTTSHEKYEPSGYKAHIDSLIETFHFTNMFNLPRASTKYTHSPIFIIGMPRSGTSLVEQILAAHPDVTGGGELTYIQSIINNLPKVTGSSRPWPFCIFDINKDNINSLAKFYMDNLSQLASNTHYVTDKMPHNFHAIGLIRLLFPNANVIHCTRYPLDTCISIYFQKFKEGHPYSKNLFQLGTHYHQYQRIMEHWKTSLSFDMFEIKYEDLVQNPKHVISTLLKYCDLDWNDNCMEFDKVKRYVLTASFDQVRQPLNSRSVNRWRHYEHYLDDLKEGLNRGY